MMAARGRIALVAVAVRIITITTVGQDNKLKAPAEFVMLNQASDDQLLPKEIPIIKTATIKDGIVLLGSHEDPPYFRLAFRKATF